MKVLMLMIHETSLVHGRINLKFKFVYIIVFCRFAWVDSLFAELVLTHLDQLEEWLLNRRNIK